MKITKILLLVMGLGICVLFISGCAFSNKTAAKDMKVMKTESSMMPEDSKMKEPMAEEMKETMETDMVEQPMKPEMEETMKTDMEKPMKPEMEDNMKTDMKKPMENGKKG